jgi:type IV secretory pathway TrbD component
MMEQRYTVIHKSLHEIKRIAGVESRLAILNGTMVAAFVMGLGMWHFIPLGFGAHIFLAWVTKKDAWARQIYIRYVTQADRYDPWPHAVQNKNKRPEGFGRGMLC